MGGVERRGLKALRIDGVPVQFFYHEEQVGDGRKSSVAIQLGADQVDLSTRLTTDLPGLVRQYAPDVEGMPVIAGEHPLDRRGKPDTEKTFYFLATQPYPPDYTGLKAGERPVGIADKLAAELVVKSKQDTALERCRCTRDVTNYDGRNWFLVITNLDETMIAQDDISISTTPNYGRFG